MLKEFGVKLSGKIEELRRKVFELAGTEFNINFFETKAPAVYKVYSEYGIVQAVQYIIGGDIKKNNNIISYGRFKLDKKWAESDMNFLAIIGDYIGRVYLKERKR